MSAETPSLPGSFTRTEIFQQPDLWPTTLEKVKRARVQELSGPVILTGAGTSAYAAAAIAESWPRADAVPTTDLLVASRAEIESKYSSFAQHGLLISIARSGDSPESVAVVNRVRKFFPSVRHLVITCNAGGKLAKLDAADRVILDPRTNDQSLAMTSSFSNLTLAGLCLRGRAEIETALPAIRQRVEGALPMLDAAAKSIPGPLRRVVVLGSGALRPLASEACLKIMEMTAGQTVTLAETFVGLRHGPMSFLDSECLVLCFLSSSRERRAYEEDLVRELREKKLGRLVGVIPEAGSADLFDVSLPAGAPELPDEFRVPFEIPFAQLLAYHLSLQSGLNPDNPSPGGIITRVVQGVRIHEESTL